MRDKNITQVSFLLNFQQQFYNLRLNRYVERGRRLVQNQQLRFQNQSSGNGNSLPLSAGKFMRIFSQIRDLQSRFRQNLQNPFPPLFPAQMRIVYKQPFADDFLNIHPRIQGIVRILKDYLNVFAQIAPFFCRQKLQFSVVETDIALKRRQADNCRSQSGFTRTGFADNSQRRSLRQFKRNAVDRSQLLNRFSPQIFLQRKSNPDVFRADQAPFRPWT